MDKNIKKLFKTTVPKASGLIKRNFELSNLTWFKVGGKAEVYFLPKDTNDLVNFLKNLDQKIPLKILGAGSNTLIRDGGIGGVTLKLSKNFSEIVYLDNEKVLVGGGLNCTKLARDSAQKNLEGLEFFSGIPGTVGGAIMMNAGAYGNETSEFLEKIITVDRNGEIKKYFKKDIKMSYRKSSLNENEIIIQALFRCKKGNKVTIKNKIKKLNQKRKLTQPIKLKTSGSTFKNPEKLKAWKLIRDSGCSKLKKGGAEVSSLHSNFIINQGIANAKDVEDLGKLIIKKVQNKFGVSLDWEIKIIGSKKKYRRYFND